jgi:hypothetical protein
MLGDVARVLTSLGITSRLYTEFEGEREVTAVGRPCIAHGAHRLEFVADERLVACVSPGLRDAVAAQAPLARPHYRRVGRSTLVVPEILECRNVDVTDHLETVPTWDIEVEGTGNLSRRASSCTTARSR